MIQMQADCRNGLPADMRIITDHLTDDEVRGFLAINNTRFNEWKNTRISIENKVYDLVLEWYYADKIKDESDLRIWYRKDSNIVVDGAPYSIFVHRDDNIQSKKFVEELITKIGGVYSYSRAGYHYCITFPVKVKTKQWEKREV